MDRKDENRFEEIDIGNQEYDAKPEKTDLENENMTEERSFQEGLLNTQEYDAKSEKTDLENKIKAIGVKIAEIIEQIRPSSNLIEFPMADGAPLRLGALIEKVRIKKQALSQFRTEKILAKRLNLYLPIALLLSVVLSYVWIESGFGLDTLSDNRIFAFAFLVGISLVIDCMGVLLLVACFQLMRAFYKTRIRLLLALNRVAFAGVTVGVLAFVGFIFMRIIYGGVA